MRQKRRIKKHAIKPKPNQAKRKPRITRADIDRLGALLEAGYGDETTAKMYFEADAIWHVQALHSIVQKAKKTKSWSHLDGCYSQAMLLYVFADMVYQECPDKILMTDAAFDKLAIWLLKRWHKLPKKYKIWYNITSLGLKAGSAFDAKRDDQLQRMLRLYKTGRVYG